MSPVVLSAFVSAILLTSRVHAVAPDKSTFTSQASNLDRRLNKRFYIPSGRAEAERLYNQATTNADFSSVNGFSIVKEFSSALSDKFRKTVSALKNSVEFAETAAMNYQWNSNISLDAVDVVQAKNIASNDTGYTYSDQFKSLINPNTSSAHIPVEIYEGDLDIVNGLKWTESLVKVWQKNWQANKDMVWQFFGSQTGILRSYPAAPWPDPPVGGVDLYDVRRRPWYTQGASSPKDMMILVDKSGSSHGQALALMKQAVTSIMETLSENDFVEVGQFSDTAEKVGCFDGFVQANHRNKEIIKKHVQNITANGKANYAAGLEYAFQQLKELEKAKGGADCNPIIMFLTDGGTETPKHIIDKYNWPKKRVRIFVYAVGPIANPISAPHWIACANRGYFAKIPAMGAIRSTVQAYLAVLARPYPLLEIRSARWTSVEFDLRGLGMMTSVTRPVYNRTSAPGQPRNQNILGVMGIDVTTQSMIDLLDREKLGPIGYTFAINANGYTIFHPNLKAQKGWLSDPPNMDLLDIEAMESLELEKIRSDMIDQKDSDPAGVTIEGYTVQPDEIHAEWRKNKYYYTKIADSSFSVAIVLPEFHKSYISGIKNMISPQEAKQLLSTDQSAILLADWNFCKNITKSYNGSALEDLVEQFEQNYQMCDNLQLQRLFFHAKVTSPLETWWKNEQKKNASIQSFFIATNGGITRVFPPEEAPKMERYANAWQTSFYQRALQNDFWIWSTEFRQEANPANVSTNPPSVMAARAIQLANGYKIAVAGVRVTHDEMLETLKNLEECKSGSGNKCYLLDDGGILLAMSFEDEDVIGNIGKFFGFVDNALMFAMIFDTKVFTQVLRTDYQATCTVRQPTVSAAPRSILIPAIMEMLSLSWWSNNLAWLSLQFSAYNWLFAPLTSAAAREPPPQSNRSCIKQMAQYYFKDRKNINLEGIVECSSITVNCSRKYVTVLVPNTNMLLLAVEDKDCNCAAKPLLHVGIEIDDPMLSYNDSITCNVTERYRRKAVKCYESGTNSTKEDEEKCRGNLTHSSLLLIVTLSLLVLIIAA